MCIDDETPPGGPSYFQGCLAPVALAVLAAIVVVVIRVAPWVW